ncbi:MAG: TraR/DksA C4-type zinc finger protein [Desulfobacterales bacterium]
MKRTGISSFGSVTGSTSSSKKVRKALDRIEDGSFGICEECGEEISIKRLKSGLSPRMHRMQNQRRSTRKGSWVINPGSLIFIFIPPLPTDPNCSLDILTRWPKTRILLLLP